MIKRTEVIHHDDGYWGVYDHDILVFLGDRDTAMMVAREVDEQWESGSGDEIEPGLYVGMEES